MEKIDEVRKTIHILKHGRPAMLDGKLIDILDVPQHVYDPDTEPMNEEQIKAALELALDLEKQLSDTPSKNADVIIKMLITLFVVIFAFWLIMSIYGSTIGEHRAITKIMLNWIFFIDMSMGIVLVTFGIISRIVHMK